MMHSHRNISWFGLVGEWYIYILVRLTIEDFHRIKIKLQYPKPRQE